MVTGSRIARSEYSQPNPINVLDAEALEQSGQTNITEFLADQPALIGSQTSTLSAGSNLLNAQQTGANFLNLRNLGTSRTLTLVNGRRHVAGYPGSAAVDTNTIPTDLVERIEVLTGGASAVYGADGVSGVVNFIMKRDFEGLRVRGQSTISQRGDAGERFASATFGKNFSDGRGNITLAYEFGENDRFSQRDRLNYGLTGPTYAFVRNPADGAPGGPNDDPNVPDRVLLTNLRWADSSPGGAVDLDGDGVPDFTGEGTPYDLGTYVPGTAFTIGGSSTPRDVYYGDYTPYLRRHAANLLARYEVSPALELYADGKYVSTKAYTYAQPTYDFYTTLYSDNAFLAQRYGPGAITGDATFNRDNFDFGIRRSELDRELYRTVVGATGEISSNLRYDLSYVFGQSTQESTSRSDRISDRYYAALDAVVNPATGQITCRINLPGETDIRYATSNGTAYRGGIFTFRPGECVPLNILGQGSPSQAALDFVTVDHSDWARIRQHVVSGTITGDSGGIFELPGGPAAFAIGAEYRKESSNYIPSEYQLRGLLEDSSPARVDKGSFDVKEAYGEINLPIFSGARFADTLSLGGALRFSDYSTIGSTTTWNVNGIYAPVREISFRGTYSEAVRAPNINELFAGGSGTYEFITDPCGPEVLAEGTQYRAANCAAVLAGLGVNPATFDPANDFTSPQNSSLLGFQGGNRELQEEKAKTWTAGVVLRPGFLGNLVLSADWWDIKLKNAIQYSAAQDIVDLCVDQPTLDNIYCDAVDRSATTGYVSFFSIIPENVASFRTAGLDLKVNYTLRTDTAGTFNASFAGTYLDRLEFVPTIGAELENELNSAAYPAPKYVAVFDLGWTDGSLRLNYGINWFSRTRRATREQAAANPDFLPKGYMWYREKWEHEVFAGYDIDDRFELYGGINNLFDRKPDRGATGYPISAVGRSFFLGVKAKLF